MRQYSNSTTETLPEKETDDILPYIRMTLSETHQRVVVTTRSVQVMARRLVEDDRDLDKFPSRLNP